MHNHLLKLLALNKGKGQLLRAEANADNTEATLYLYDMIVSDSYWGGISAMDFIKALLALDAQTIHLRINSPGGDVFAAVAMSQAMKEHPSKIIAHIDGQAASAATFLVMAADQSIIASSGLFMIHKSSTIAFGNADEFTKIVDLLTKTDTSIAAMYAEKTGKTPDNLLDLMGETTFYSAQEAVDNGFVDQIAENSPKNKIDWDLSAYGKTLPTPVPKTTDTNPETPQNDLTHLYRRLEFTKRKAA